MKIGIELYKLKKEHNGGKCQVAFNLLQGFVELGYSKDLVVFCREELVDLLKDISKELDIVVLPDYYNTNLLSRKLKVGSLLNEHIVKKNIDAVLFCDKIGPLVKTKCKSIMIAHDILVFEASHNQNIEYRTPSMFFEKLYIRVEFLIRDYIIAISEFDKAMMIKYMPWAKKKIKMISNPIHFKKMSDTTGEKKYITALNIQFAHKNTLTLIKAFELIKTEVPYDLCLIGRYPDNYEELLQYIDKNNLNNRVFFTGFISNDELKRYIDNTAIYVNPSEFEGFGMTAIEMMGNAIQTICADNSAQKETTLGLCTYYAPAKKHELLAEKILELSGAFDGGQDLLHIADIVREHYDYLKISNEYYEFLKRVCLNK